MPTTNGHEPEDVRDKGADGPLPSSEPRRGRKRLRAAVRNVAYDFTHPPVARWSAPGEDQVRSRAQRMTEAMDRSPGLRVAVVMGTLVVLGVLGVLAWQLLFKPVGDAQLADQLSETQQVLPSQGESAEATKPQPKKSGKAAKTMEPVGKVADASALTRINDNHGSSVVSARVEDADDPLVTGARFLRSLRTVDTASDKVEDWYQARDSFLAGASGGGQSGWGDAGEEGAISNAEVSWARMDSAIADERGLAPTFPYGPQVQEGSHLVQIGMRLNRSVAHTGGRLDTPSGALMEAVVMCPPATGEDRCVVTNCAESPADFVGEREGSWKAATS